MIFNILDNTTELWMTKYIIGEIFSSGRATFYKNPSDQTVPHRSIRHPTHKVHLARVWLKVVHDNVTFVTGSSSLPLVDTFLSKSLL